MRTFNSLEEYAQAVGSEIGKSRWFDVTQDKINQFADVTEDHQWIHIDPERCQRELGTGTIAHGYLVLSLLAPMAFDTFEIKGISRTINYGSDKIRFISPTPPGSRVRGVFTLTTADWRDGQLRTMQNVEVEIDGQDKPALVAQTLSLFYPA